jgi:O-antigen/teichoic acid export membrane protein
VAPSRTRRLLGGISLGYLQAALSMVVALWLTPFLLHHLEEHDYGLWLLAAQMLFYLALTDIGLVALVPRDVAFATGRGGDVQHLVGETSRIVLWQLPLAAMTGGVMWWVVSAKWPALAGPFALVVATFLLTFRFRIFPAVLQGMQDLAFVAGTQLVGWITGTVLTVVLVDRRLGIGALAAGWAFTQLLVVGLAWWRVVRRFPEALPKRLPPVSRGAARARLGRSIWVSVSQVAQVLVNGTDFLVVGALLGPAAVVPYACTGKLVTILANQPQLFMQMALPALSQLRGSLPRDEMFRVSTSLSQLLLLCSGGIACVVLAANGPFVTWWVGSDRFAGSGLTALLLASMLLRHWNVAAVYTLFCFGHERRLALTTAIDGLSAVLAMFLLVPRLGLYGAALGSIFGTVAVSLPANLRALAREEGVSLRTAIRPLRPWFVRVVPVFATVFAANVALPVPPLVTGAVAGVLVAIAYVAVMMSVALQPPLGTLLAPRLQQWLTVVPGLSRRLAREPLP